MSKHERSPDIVGVSNEDLFKRYAKAFKDIVPDWHAFADAQTEGLRRAQHRVVGGGGSGKHADPNVIPPGQFTVSVMLLPPGQGAKEHTHEVEEVLFVLQGELTVTLQDEQGRIGEKQLSRWDCASCPAGVPHGFWNRGTEDVYVQVMLGKGRPGAMGMA